MSATTRTLTGARWSSAVRCIAKASFEGLGAPRDDEAQQYLQKYFRRGVNVGRAWALTKREELQALGHDVVLEEEVPWGLGWVAHTDMTDHTAKVVYEAFHAAGGSFREEKAWQAAGSADSLGPEYTAELAVIDTTDVSDEEGFAVQPYEINVDGLRDRVRDIKARVVAAVEAGAVNPADKVSDTPHHQECRSCPFAATCWAGWQPPAPEEVAGLEADFDALRILSSDLYHAEAKVAELKRIRDEKRAAIRPYVRPGIPTVSGNTLVKVTEVAGRTSFKIRDATKAGYSLPAELAPFVVQSQPSERWKVEAV